MGCVCCLRSRAPCAYRARAYDRDGRRAGCSIARGGDEARTQPVAGCAEKVRACAREPCAVQRDGRAETHGVRRRYVLPPAGRRRSRRRRSRSSRRTLARSACFALCTRASALPLRGRHARLALVCAARRPHAACARRCTCHVIQAAPGVRAELHGTAQHARRACPLALCWRSTRTQWLTICRFDAAGRGAHGRLARRRARRAAGHAGCGGAAAWSRRLPEPRNVCHHGRAAAPEPVRAMGAGARPAGAAPRLCAPHLAVLGHTHATHPQGGG